MASPNMLALREQWAALRSVPVVLAAPGDAPRDAPPGESLAELFIRCRARNQRRAQAAAGRQDGRDVPTSGTQRRRAKTHRRRGLCLAPVGNGMRCPERAERCKRHAGTAA